MTKVNDIELNRRVLLKTGATSLALGAVAAAGLAGSRRALAQTQMSQATAMYQPTPHGQQVCANCIHFVPGQTPDAMGTCKVVEGAISPKGWCVAYAPKS